MTRAQKVKFDYSLGEDAVTLKVSAKVTPGTRDHYCRSLGGWLPGDPPEVEIEAVTVDGRAFITDDIAVKRRGIVDKANPWESLDDRLREVALEESAKS